jgi:hypothetical protein
MPERTAGARPASWTVNSAARFFMSSPDFTSPRNMKSFS